MNSPIYTYQLINMFSVFSVDYSQDPAVGGGYTYYPETTYSESTAFSVLPNNPFGLSNFVYNVLTYIVVFFALSNGWSLIQNILALKSVVWESVTGRGMRSLEPETAALIMNSLDEVALKFVDYIKQ